MTNPSPYMYLLRLADARRPAVRDRRVQPRGAGHGAGRGGHHPPHRRHALARGGRRGGHPAGQGPPRRREGARRAPHARRPRAQRPRARLRAGHGAGPPASSRSSATATSCTSSARSAAASRPGAPRSTPWPRCFPAGTLSGAPKPQGARDHRGARAHPARALRRHRRLPRLRRRRRHRHRDPHRAAARRRRLRPVRRRASWPTPTRSPRTPSASTRRARCWPPSPPPAPWPRRVPAAQPDTVARRPDPGRAVTTPEAAPARRPCGTGRLFGAIVVLLLAAASCSGARRAAPGSARSSRACPAPAPTPPTAPPPSRSSCRGRCCASPRVGGLLATSGWGRRVVGTLVAVAGLWALLRGVAGLADPASEALPIGVRPGDRPLPAEAVLAGPALGGARRGADARRGPARGAVRRGAAAARGPLRRPDAPGGGRRDGGADDARRPRPRALGSTRRGVRPHRGAAGEPADRRPVVRIRRVDERPVAPTGSEGRKGSRVNMERTRTGERGRPGVSVLEQILEGVRADLAARQAAVPFDDVKDRGRGRPPALDALAALQGPGIGVIAEVKRASPSQGRTGRHPRPGVARRRLRRRRRPGHQRAHRAALLRRLAGRPRRRPRHGRRPGAAQGLRGRHLPGARGPGPRRRPRPAHRARCSSRTRSTPWSTASSPSA